MTPPMASIAVPTKTIQAIVENCGFSFTLGSVAWPSDTGAVCSAKLPVL
jgi:hypothetical protein